MLKDIAKEHNRIIVFYNFNYELAMLRDICTDEAFESFEIAEWNGQKHEPIPNCEKWLYLVQYTAGAEGWNCITTNAMVFFSPNYSYKIMQQSAGRIDRLNTPFKELYYYHLKTRSGIDIAIDRAIRQKEQFNERKFASSI